uniref:Cyclin-D2-1-like n=1 Tax=Nelumbo nucifera TaxID=4432 RepID=A0A822XML5_NELNU|nr:TPA_asm: hypothetical protein HUJ06_022745 [Nelumbo nucifera]
MMSDDHSVSSLYCCEGDAIFWDTDTCSPDPSITTNTYLSTTDDDDGQERNRFFATLMDSELHHLPVSDYQRRFFDRSIDATARQDAINWMLKVHTYYHFRPVTAYLSVNYLDRFLCSHNLPHENGWPLQLLSVACVSIAAKMEEASVPLLLDLQMVVSSRFVFEPRTVQRMELLVMTNLKWRMRSITPFDFVDYFVSKLPCFSSRHPFLSCVSSRASDLILSTTLVDFLGFTPSTIAAAAVLCAARRGVDSTGSGSDDRGTATFFDKMNREMVKSCHQLMEEYLVDTCPMARLKHRRTEPEPPSPVGVLDAAACRSCDTQKSGAENPDPSPGELPNKRQRSSGPSDVHQL